MAAGCARPNPSRQRSPTAGVFLRNLTAEQPSRSSAGLGAHFVPTGLVLQEGQRGIVFPDMTLLLSTILSCAGTILSFQIQSCPAGVPSYGIRGQSCSYKVPFCSSKVLSWPTQVPSCPVRRHLVLLRCHFVLSGDQVKPSFGCWKRIIFDPLSPAFPGQ